MAHIVLLHSVLGLRPVELGMKARWEAAGHSVTLPDLYDGASAESYEEGFALRKEIGDAVGARARAAILAAPKGAVLSGVSLGAMFVGESWSERPDIRGAVFFAGGAEFVPGLRRGLKVQAHIARPDPFDDEDYFASWAATKGDAELEIFRYDGVGHYFLDRALTDYGEAEAELCLSRVDAFLAGL
ncbi:dienelactone hydrolase family protein [Pseudoroseicyclus sp. CXY001]|uniref:dienelactone hydrolase family protein n=1 Tax=Pseudoroseicyclus sp. CXY001 TaxID=3242492 RepID=UPI003570F3F7